MSQSRWVGLLAGVLALLAAVVWVRRYIAETQPALAPSGTMTSRTEDQRPVFAQRRPLEPALDDNGNAVQEWAHRPEPRPRRGEATVGSRTAITPSKPGAGPAGSAESSPAAAAPGDGAIIANEPGRPASSRFAVSFDGSVTADNQTAPAIEQGVEIDPKGGAALFPPTAVLAYPDAGGVNPEEGTIALWVRRATDPQDEKGRAFIELRTNTWENRIQFGMGPTYLRFMLTTSDGVEVGVGSGIDWAQGEWHHVAATWGQALTVLYVDGAVRDQRTYDGTVAISPSALLYVGSTSQGPRPDAAPISLRGLVILQYAAAADEVLSLESQTAPAAG